MSAARLGACEPGSVVRDTRARSRSAFEAQEYMPRLARLKTTRSALSVPGQGGQSLVGCDNDGARPGRGVPTAPVLFALKMRDCIRQTVERVLHRPISITRCAITRGQVLQHLTITFLHAH